MILRESIHIAAPADAVWQLIADPEWQMQWNLRLVGVDRRATGPVTFRERYAITVRLNDKDKVAQVEVAECEPPRKLSLVQRLDYATQPGRAGEQTMIETYTVTDEGDGVRVAQTVDLSQADVQWWVRALFRFFQWFGTRAEPSRLENLKRLVENAGP